MCCGIGESSYGYERNKVFDSETREFLIEMKAMIGGKGIETRALKASPRADATSESVGFEAPPRALSYCRPARLRWEKRRKNQKVVKALHGQRFLLPNRGR